MTTRLPPNDPETDDQLPGEDELSALYRRLPQSEPGPALDSAILAAAASALDSDRSTTTTTIERRKSERESGDWVHPKTGPSPTRTPVAPVRRNNAPRWLIGLGSAATLVLAAGLAWHMREMPQAYLKPAAIVDGASQPQAAAPVGSSGSEAAPPAASVQADKLANPLPPAKLQGVNAVSPAAAEARARDSAEAYARNEASARQQQTSRENAEASRSAVLQKRAASAARQATSADRTLMPAAPPAVMEIDAPATAPQNESDTSVQAGDTPEQELAKIQRLLQQQHEVEARQRLQAFMQTHPQWNLPPDLRDLLKQP